MNKYRALGLVLISLGVVLAIAHMDYINGVWVLPAISAGLLTLYVVFGAHRSDSNLGFLIPGSILGAVGLYAVLNTYGVLDNGKVFLIFFGAAFLNVMFVHTLRSGDSDWGARYWPIFPAGVFLIIGTAATLNIHVNLSAWLMPIGLVIAGAVVLFKNWNAR